MRNTSLVLSLAALAASCLPLQAADVVFSGTLSGACSLALSTPGVLQMTPQVALSSTAGVPAVLTVLSVGSNTLTVTPPSGWASSPAGYEAGTETFEVAYAGLSGAGLANQDFTSQETTRNLDSLPITALTMNARATNSAGFIDGNYELRVVVTCG